MHVLTCKPQKSVIFHMLQIDLYNNVLPRQIDNMVENIRPPGGMPGGHHDRTVF